ncbi:MAG: alkaline phosphatase family protein [Bacteroidia bacterium]|nr:alkaline phosphatase family protein [Bacteroidia bacterium]MCX7764121.1 alkaline phosphatase family protein [Bacteroidia bacterium]MDW8057548.1 alkaline phosphatase D family protein [Bacteroidia bacterium]
MRLAFLLVLGFVLAQKVGLQAGPMLGYAQMREVALWLQTTAPAKVQIEYADTAQPTRKFRTPAIQTEASTAYTALFKIGPLEPGRVYRYAVLINGRVYPLSYPTYFRTLPQWRWRSAPPDFRFVIGSCAYINDSLYDRPGEPYGGNYEIFSAIAAQKPDFMLWLGDNVYLREADWNSRSGILYRYTHTRSLPQLQPLLATCPHYAIWDDHDFGPNDSDRGFWGRALTREAFMLFWANPSYGVPSAPEGITTFFEWSDAEFFLLDNRTYRAPNKRKTGSRTMLGSAQLEWLIDALKSSHATFKFVVCGSQILNPTGGYENFINFPEERELLLKRIQEEGITGVIFLTGDRHYSEISALTLPNGQKVYDITSSPLTASPFTAVKEKDKNPLRIAETLTPQRNFLLLSVTGAERERRLKVSAFSSGGEKLWEYEIKAAELRPKQ